MIWIFNGFLVLLGIPFLGSTFLLVAFFYPGLSQDFKWPAYFIVFGTWSFFLAVFVFIYRNRTRWLEKIGIFKSWGNFKAYVLENHGYPQVTEQEKARFLSWANLSEQRPCHFRKTIKEIYQRIDSEMTDKEEKELYIKCLAWYATGWPIRDDIDEEY